ncbi:tRNA lysidine(34) synthetase TilS [Sciscionella marina]|uniref:tRNA lysidine(34) synthetase TilS n=1 Tax=Sciscionella marina TaxID=508770 RepID=UPI000A3054E8
MAEHPPGPLSIRDPRVAAVRSAVREHLDLLEAQTFVVALSGGPDSLALAALAIPLAHRNGKRVRCLVVDHRLQQGSAEVAEAAAAQARELGADEARVLEVRVGESGGPEAAAREARYPALRAAAGDAPVLLGHTLDDQAETVLLGLARGSGARSIAGMAPFDGGLVRPLLGVRRTDTEGTCAALGLPFWSDPHNTDRAYTRVRLRTEVLPLLEEVLHGGVAEALARTAGQVREDSAVLDELAASERASGDLSVRELAALAGPVRRRVLRRWLLGSGVRELSDAHLRAVESLVTAWRGQGPHWLPGGIAVLRERDALTVRQGG